MRLWFVAVAVVASVASVASVAVVACQPSSTTMSPTSPTSPSVGVTMVRVDVWHDTICPWCRIGLHNLDGAVVGLEGVEVVHHPFLLNPDAPPGGSDLRAELGSKFGADRVDAMLARVSDAGAAAGVGFNWDKVRRSPNTVASHVVIAATPVAQRAAVVEGIHRAHFDEGRDIGDVEVLVAVAGAAGVAGELVRAALADPRQHKAIQQAALEASRRGVRGVPHIEVGGQVLRGATTVPRLQEAIGAARSTRR